MEIDGLTYTDQEVDGLRGLPSSEALVIHELKACFQVEERSTQAEMGAPDGSAASDANRPQFLDPEEIPFGREDASIPRNGTSSRLKPSQSIIELSWTWDKHRVCKTKKLANRKIRAWKRWYQRLGWKIYPGEDGCIANHPDGTRHAITLRVWPKPVSDPYTERLFT